MYDSLTDFTHFITTPLPKFILTIIWYSQIIIEYTLFRRDLRWESALSKLKLGALGMCVQYVHLERRCVACAFYPVAQTPGPSHTTSQFSFIFFIQYKYTYRIFGHIVQKKFVFSYRLYVEPVRILNSNDRFVFEVLVAHAYKICNTEFDSLTKIEAFSQFRSCSYFYVYVYIYIFL